MLPAGAFTGHSPFRWLACSSISTRRTHTGYSPFDAQLGAAEALRQQLNEANWFLWRNAAYVENQDRAALHCVPAQQPEAPDKPKSV
ncbi:MAG: hypothetical protein ACLVHV_03390 [Oscillospiraceae bacterium]